MNWTLELLDLYDKNSSEIGVVSYKKIAKKKDAKKEQQDDLIPYILLPESHITVNAHITVKLNDEGDFLGAEIVGMDDRSTVIPVTETSASRTSTADPHPLCDNLKYVAGDFGKYSTQKKDYSKFYEMYLEALKKWVMSAYTHDKIKAIYTYLLKNCLIKDLIKIGVLTLTEQGKMDPKNKISGVVQEEAFIRFQVENHNCLEMGDEYQPECWKDRSLQNSFSEYYRSTLTEKDLSYLTGDIVPIANLHPKKIRNEGDFAKLFSSNDSVNFTYRGYFRTKSEAFCIGYEDSQKIHNALRWIIRKQGYTYDTLCVVIWESDLRKLPDLRKDSDSIVEELKEFDFDDLLDDEEDNRYYGTNALNAVAFNNAMRGYKNTYTKNSKTVLLSFDSATQGRLAMTAYKDFASSDYIENIAYWHETCQWQHTKFKDGRLYTYEGMAGITSITEALYATEQEGRMVMGDKKKKDQRCGILYKRLLPCITERQKLPYDLVQLAVHRASSPSSYKKLYNWIHILEVACSFVKKNRNDTMKEKWDMALDRECNQRDYLFGRLLAVADHAETMTQFKKGTEVDGQRETNARRFMSAFSQRPMKTWKMIEERLEPYWFKLSKGTRIFLQNEMNEIFNKFDIDSFSEDSTLSGLYLLGYHSQLIALKSKKKEDAQNE